MTMGELSAVVICIDYRFQHQALELLEQKYGALDVVALAGANKNLASPNHPEDKHAIVESIGTSIRLHHPKTLILTNHLDCGAYGGSKNFASYQAEVDFHKTELQKAKQIAGQEFPGTKIELIFLNKDKYNNVLLDSLSG